MVKLPEPRLSLRGLRLGHEGTDGQELLGNGPCPLGEGLLGLNPLAPCVPAETGQAHGEGHSGHAAQEANLQPIPQPQGDTRPPVHYTRWL